VPGLTLQLLGPPSVAVPRAATGPGVHAAKSLALLAYLALEPGSHSREELATLLWGESPERAARASLRQALRWLRASIGDALRIGGDTVELCGPVECDVLAFLEAATHRPEQAATFDVPRFLAGFSLHHAPAFDEWAAAKRGELVRRYEEVLRATTSEAIGRSHWGEAVAWTERWLTCDPLSEEATRLAMEAQYLAGDRGMALARFASYRERLAHEIGAEPGAALIELARRIEADAGGGATPRQRQPHTEDTAGVPSFQASLVGRERQWRALLDAWRAVAGGAGRVVLLEGEAGVGKTRLAEEFLRLARAEGGTVLRGRGYDPAAGMPYGPLVEAIREVLDAPGLAGAAPEYLAEASRLVPELRRRFPALPEPAAPADLSGRPRLFESVAQILLAAAAERPTILFIDDLHWCDGETCALLHFLTRRFEDAPVAVMATLTLGELERDAPAARLYRALHTQRGTTVVAVPPLAEEEVWSLIRELARIEAPTGGRRFARRVHEVTDGNPFHVVELLKTLFAQGVLAIDPASGAWTVSPGVGGQEYSHLPMAETVREAIAERVARLPYELRDLLATIAVSGRGCRADLLSHVHGVSRLRAAALADALVERRLLVEEQVVYRCAHPVIADVVRDLLTPARRRELHRAIALSLVTIPAPLDPGELAGEVARHAERGGERALAYRYALLASEAAATRYAFEEALTSLDLASSMAEGAAETDDVNRRTAHLLGLAGWSEPPRTARRRSGPGRAIERRDLDLGAPTDRA